MLILSYYAKIKKVKFKAYQYIASALGRCYNFLMFRSSTPKHMIGVDHGYKKHIYERQEELAKTVASWL